MYKDTQTNRYTHLASVNCEAISLSMANILQGIRARNIKTLPCIVPRFLVFFLALALASTRLLACLCHLIRSVITAVFIIFLILARVLARVVRSFTLRDLGVTVAFGVTVGLIVIMVIIVVIMVIFVLFLKNIFFLNNLS